MDIKFKLLSVNVYDEGHQYVDKKINVYSGKYSKNSRRIFRYKYSKLN